MLSLPLIRPVSPLGALRRRVRASEAALIVLAGLVGLTAGLTTLIQSGAAHLAQMVLYGIGVDDRLSAAASIAPVRLLALPLGGLALAGVNHLVRRRERPPVDVVEANALHGGAIPLRDSLLVCGQTLVSNGAGASVGLEAAYAQLGGGLASVAGRWLRLRRADLRILVGAGAGAAVGAAFGAPLTGAFYAFEIVIGAYTPAAIAPVVAAALAATVTVRAAGAPAYLFVLPTATAIRGYDYFLYASLGLTCALIGVALMRTMTLIEGGVRRSPLPDRWRPAIGGLLLIPLALTSPQTLSAGHGALHLDLVRQVSLPFLVTIFLLKIAAVAISLGFGFRGGMFYASLFLCSLIGQIFAGVVSLLPGAVAVDANDAALVGMAAMAVSVIGGPMTMSLLVLEATHDFALTGAALFAALCASTLVRETFGFSFSTWRLHTRGETIRSARDIGWMKSLTAGRMMRGDPPAIPAGASLAEFRERFPLGAARAVVATDPAGRYAGIVLADAAWRAEAALDAPVSTLARLRRAALAPDLDVAAVMHAFEEVEADDLAVVDAGSRVIGLVSERFVRRRYTEEIEKAQRDLFGE